MQEIDQGKDMQEMNNFTMMIAGMTERFNNNMLKVVNENYHYCSILVLWVLELMGLSLVKKKIRIFGI